MCGILGIAGTNRSIGEDAFMRALHKLDHRGPDASSQLCLNVGGAEVRLGHTRLAIIDLNKQSDQPMRSSCGRYYISFNGEIYNYKELRSELALMGCAFTTGSDTEVLLNALIKWGEESLVRFKGIFSFAFVDVRRGRLLLVRDAFGIKPLFYRAFNEGIYFASELEALKRICPDKIKLNDAAVLGYLTSGRYDRSALTMYEGIYNLRPGCMLDYDLSGNRYEVANWWYPSLGGNRSMGLSEAAERLRELLKSTVSLNLRSDVPVAAALSGGVDSSAIVCLGEEVSPGAIGAVFTYAAEGYAFDERGWAESVARAKGIKQFVVKATQADFAEDIDELIRLQGEPFGSASLYAQFRVFKEVRERGFKVILDGQGADELFAGYRGYPDALIAKAVRGGNVASIVNFLIGWHRHPGRKLTYAFKLMLAQMTPDVARAVALRLAGKRKYLDWIDRDYYDALEGWVDFPGERVGEFGGAADEILGITLRNEALGGGLHPLLRHGDLSSMAHSVESRVPFCDLELADFSLALADELLVDSAFNTKVVLREAVRGLVPNGILDRKDKIGFEGPEKDWLVPFAAESNKVLEPLRSLPYVNFEKCKRDFEGMLQGSKPFDWRAWRIFNMARWLEVGFS